MDYSNIGLNINLTKISNTPLQMIDPETQIEDGSIRGTKLSSLLNGGTIYIDSAAAGGKHRFVIQFATGAIQVIATEP